MRFIMRKCLWLLAMVAMGYSVFLFATGQFQDTHLALLVGAAAAVIMLTIGKFWRKIKYAPIRIFRKVLRLWL